MLQAGQSVALPDGRIIEPSQVTGPTRSGRVIAYCTDTAPCPAVVENSQDADLLIHDGTFTAEFEEQARISGHSTAGQAAQVALDAGCHRLALTHISARFDDDKPLLDEAMAIFPETFVARDLMEVRVPARK